MKKFIFVFTFIVACNQSKFDYTKFNSDLLEVLNTKDSNSISINKLEKRVYYLISRYSIEIYKDSSVNYCNNKNISVSKDKYLIDTKKLPKVVNIKNCNSKTVSNTKIGFCYDSKLGLGEISIQSKLKNHYIWLINLEND